MKRCTKCKRELPLSEFSPDKQTKSGLRFWCKKCECEHKRTLFERKNPGARKYHSYNESHRITNGVQMKFCSCCSIWKSTDAFSRHRTSKDKLNSQCKACNKAYAQAHRIETNEYQRKQRHTLKGYLQHIFRDMNQRCNNPNAKDYDRYGGKGVKNLFGSSEKFFIHVTVDMNLTYDDIKDKDIHRIHNENYEPGEIEWLTRAEHAAKHRAMREQEKGRI